MDFFRTQKKSRAPRWPRERFHELRRIPPGARRLDEKKNIFADGIFRAQKILELRIRKDENCTGKNFFSRIFSSARESLELRDGRARGFMSSAAFRRGARSSNGKKIFFADGISERKKSFFAEKKIFSDGGAPRKKTFPGAKKSFELRKKIQKHLLVIAELGSMA